jgi:PAP2 superfamily
LSDAGAELTITANAKRWPENFHYWASASLALAMVPSLKRLDLPIVFDWSGLAFGYWVVLAAKSIFVATLLYLVEFAPEGSIDPELRRVLVRKELILLALAYFLVLTWLLNWAAALVLTLLSVAMLEVRRRIGPNGFLRSARAILPPAVYLFFGILLVSAYNDIILSIRFFAAYDGAFNSMDKWLLHGYSVPELCHRALQGLPISFFHFLELVYYGMFAVLGAGLILVCQHFGRGRGLQFVGAILTAYYLALALFYIWPSQGPFYLCPVHFSKFPKVLETYGLQKWSIAGAQALWNHQRLSRISFAYYIAFPCMHIVQPLIVMWFLWSWKRTRLVLAGYNALLVVAIVLLEWHYIVDVLAGIMIAVLAIAAVDGREMWRSRGVAKGEIGEPLGNAISP